MFVKVDSKEELKICNSKIKSWVETNNQLFCTKYIDLGVKVVRVLCYTPLVLPMMQKQLTFTLKDNADRYDATLVVWQEKDIKNFAEFVSDKFNPRKNMRLRLEVMVYKVKEVSFFMVDETSSPSNPVLLIDGHSNVIEAADEANDTYYYGVENLEPEEFIKQGHIFVQMLNKIIKTPTSNLAHGAIVGFDNNGVLFCARGQRGKSTLTVLSMLKGFEYVSDDYLILNKRGDEILASPIYSIITLSPRMYNELYDELDGKFVCNNARKDKYVVNIEKYHSQFRVDYPIRLCIFPEIVSDKEPSIYPCTAEDKGRAIVQLIQSTLAQVRDLNDQKTIKKMFDMVKDLEFYKFNLCNDIQRNTEFLREFLTGLRLGGTKNQKTPKIMTDITFDLANILDSETYTIYSLNKLATNLLENLQNGVSEEKIAAALVQFKDKNQRIGEQFAILVKVCKDKNFIKPSGENKALEINQKFAKEDDFRLSVTEFSETGTKELIK